jgi:Bacteriophage Mu Gam like protein
MNTPRPDFLAELLAENEDADQQKRIEMDRLRADQLLAAVAVLEGHMEEVNQLVEQEIRLLEEYRSSELSRLDKKRSWLVFNLDGFMRTTGDKTIRLPHGVLKLRKGRDHVVVVALDQFLEVAPKLGLVRTVPEQLTPDMQAIVTHIKTTGEIPAGVEFIAADTRFSYTTTTKGETDERE